MKLSHIYLNFYSNVRGASSTGATLQARQTAATGAAAATAP
jgi:hypothetical protein